MRDLTRSAHDENQTSPGRPSSKRTLPPVSNSSISSDTARLHARPTTSLNTPSCFDESVMGTGGRGEHLAKDELTGAEEYDDVRAGLLTRAVAKKKTPLPLLSAGTKQKAVRKAVLSYAIDTRRAS